MDVQIIADIVMLKKWLFALNGRLMTNDSWKIMVLLIWNKYGELEMCNSNA